jgi:hypothetical protein
MRFTNNFQLDECSIPEGMTIEEWRRSRSAPRPRRTLRERARRRSRRSDREGERTTGDR